MNRAFTLGICLVLAGAANRGRSRGVRSIPVSAHFAFAHGSSFFKTTAQASPAADLDQRLAKWQRVDMPFASARLTPRERRLIEKLVEASQYLDDIFWRQSDPAALEIFKSIAASHEPQDVALRRLLMINGCRYDLLDNNRPFAGKEVWSPGRGLYPSGLTREQIESYVERHPEKKAEIYSPYTIVRHSSPRGGELISVPYHQAYAPLLRRAAEALRRAADLSEDEQFARFLRLRAVALLNDDYYHSDVAWLELKHPRFDVIMAPYETYLDDVLGVKTSYGAAVLVRNEEESNKLKLYQRYVPQIQEALPIPPEDRPSARGQLTPMEMMDSPFRGGDLRHGYQAVADNLPNDPRIHREKGTKKIFFKNIMDARVNYVILPLAGKLMRSDQAAKVSAEGYLASTVLHEIAHGLGPAYARLRDRQTDIRESVGPVYSGLEEAKADVVGMFGLKWLMDHGILPASRMDEYCISYVAGLLRTVRYGTAEAHGQAEMMEFNYLGEQKAVLRDAADERYSVDSTLMPAVLTRLARELLEMEAAGDRLRAEAWFKRYGTMPAGLSAALQGASEIPVDVDPVFAFPEQVQ